MADYSLCRTTPNHNKIYLVRPEFIWILAVCMSTTSMAIFSNPLFATYSVYARNASIVRDFYTPNYPALVYHIWRDSLHRLQSYCWETAHRSLTMNFCMHPVGKTMRWIKKWLPPLLNGLDLLYHHAGRFSICLHPFSEVSAFSEALDNSYLVARWHHNFLEIVVKTCEKSKNWRKSLCTALRTDSWEIWRIFHSRSLEPRT